MNLFSAIKSRSRALGFSAQPFHCHAATQASRLDTCLCSPSNINWYKPSGGATRKAFGLAISRSRVQILLEATLRNNLRQVVYTYVPLSPSSMTWYRPKGGDALRLGR